MWLDVTKLKFKLSTQPNITIICWLFNSLKNCIKKVSHSWFVYEFIKNKKKMFTASGLTEHKQTSTLF